LPLSASNTLRGGDTASNTIGVFTYTWAGNSASGNAYRVRPLTALGGYINFDPANDRPAGPTAVGGTIRATGMNLLNFFNTFDGLPDTVDNCNNGVSGPSTDCRGADTQSEFDRQWPKTVAAIIGTDADVIGIVEIENDGYGPNSAIQFLIDRLNDATAPGTYAFIDVDAATGQVDALGSDAIKVGLVYRTANVMPVGDTAVLNTTSFINGGDASPRNRASLAQAFEEIATGARFIVNVNHLKSKGSACTAPDAGDGQGNCNIVRLNAANELMSWLATDPTGTGDPDVLIVGDLNSYAMEDPITAILSNGYTNLLLAFGGPDAYSYVFDGQWGYLDHALASPSLFSQVVGVTEWHINADEPSVLDYNTDFKSAAQIIDLYAPDQYRISDHDPVIVGLALNAPPTVSAGGPYSVNEGGSVLLTASGSDPEGQPLTYAWDLDNNGSYETAGQSATFSAAALDGPGSATVGVQVTDIGGLTAVSTTTITINNVAPTVDAPTFSPASSILGSSMAASATFSDPAPNDAPFSCTVDYGDGSGAQAGSISGNSCDGPGHTYAAVGSYAVTVAVTDKDGGVGLNTAVHSVIFNFIGFFSPVDNLPMVNTVKAGSSVPIKFSLSGDQGLSIFAISYPRSQAVTCDSSASLNDVETALNPGSSGLTYDPLTGQYNFVWKTNKAWAGTCRLFTVRFVDGTEQFLLFKFK
ncbi:MAG: ExeM/NucH family extracellular endonuclease, partial [Ardenticatenaceae bacterium]|nr:ExeM/NucH family extracellular endonuclease [Ardenticatenaceae bacterium]